MKKIKNHQFVCNKIIVIIVVMLMFYINAFAQPNNVKLIDNEEKKSIENKLIESSQNIKSLQCNFKQEKTSTLLTEKSVFTGKLSYNAPLFLKWEYNSPLDFALIIDKNEIYIQNENGTNSNSNKMFKYLGEMIISVINGNILTDTKNFKTEYYNNEKDSETIIVKLIPVQKRVKDIFSAIQIKIDTKNWLANEIFMDEKSGDTTIIFLTHIKVN
ncbi:MAG: outer membrane lipoprotein carrier protein LolA [Marinilabiliaceae bacterium]|nr:outer membrane lipoprotein carrier protein LolA [Marinilabiliaceae bacterium]